MTTLTTAVAVPLNPTVSEAANETSYEMDIGGGDNFSPGSPATSEQHASSSSEPRKSIDKIHLY